MLPNDDNESGWSRENEEEVVVKTVQTGIGRADAGEGG